MHRTTAPLTSGEWLTTGWLRMCGSQSSLNGVRPLHFVPGGHGVPPRAECGLQMQMHCLAMRESATPVLFRPAGCRCGCRSSTTPTACRTASSSTSCVTASRRPKSASSSMKRRASASSRALFTSCLLLPPYSHMLVQILFHSPMHGLITCTPTACCTARAMAQSASWQLLADGLETFASMRKSFVGAQVTMKHEWVGRGADGFPSLEGKVSEIRGKHLMIRCVVAPSQICQQQRWWWWCGQR